VFFLNDSTGWAVGYLGTIIKTGDYGKNWEIQNSHVADSLMGVHFKDKNIGCVVGANGLILQTTEIPGISTIWGEKNGFTIYTLLMRTLDI
jgi:photosystem II stability/assembly factor-like uncharacterized protein